MTPNVRTTAWPLFVKTYQFFFSLIQALHSFHSVPPPGPIFTVFRFFRCSVDCFRCFRSQGLIPVSGVFSGDVHRLVRWPSPRVLVSWFTLAATGSFMPLGIRKTPNKIMPLIRRFRINFFSFSYIFQKIHF